MPSRVLHLAAIAALASLAPSALAGPLDPPAGPIAPTYKTLADVEPRTAINAANTPGDADSVYRISTPGSYSLTASLTAPVGKSAVEIAASNVSIDMNGFTITSLATLGAVRLSGDNRSNISVRNGAIGTCLGDGIDLRPVGALVSAVATGGTIENITVSNASGSGIRVGHGFTFTGVTVRSCGESGIVARDACTFIACTAVDNEVHGIYAWQGCSFSNCTFADNDASGISTAGNSSVANCSAQGNTSYGLLCGGGSSIVNCTVLENGDVGIYASGPASISNCTAKDNRGIGFYTEFFSSTVTDCAAFGNDADGFSIGGSSVVVNCTAATNGANGFLIGDGTQVLGCNANQNVLDGVRCGHRCVVEGCLLRTNGFNAGIGAGIHATGSDNRIEKNHSMDNDFGIDVDGVGNVVVRNTCTANTQNFVLGPNNIHGTIVDRTAPGTPAVVGSSAAGTMGSNDPNANFAH